LPKNTQIAMINFSLKTSIPRNKKNKSDSLSKKGKETKK